MPLLHHRLSALLLTPLLLAGPIACRSADEGAAGGDGFYRVLAESGDRDGLPGIAAGQSAIPRAPEATDPPDAPIAYVLVDDTPGVRLALASEPVWNEEGERPCILISLDPACQKQVSEFTAAHVGDQVALVIAGEAVSVHKVREPIHLPELKISSCAPGGLERIWAAFQAR